MNLFTTLAHIWRRKEGFFKAKVKKRKEKSGFTSLIEGQKKEESMFIFDMMMNFTIDDIKRVMIVYLLLIQIFSYAECAGNYGNSSST